MANCSGGPIGLRLVGRESGRVVSAAMTTPRKITDLSVSRSTREANAHLFFGQSDKRQRGWNWRQPHGYTTVHGSPNAGLHRTEPAAGSGTVRGLVGHSES